MQTPWNNPTTGLSCSVIMSVCDLSCARHQPRPYISSICSSNLYTP